MTFEQELIRLIAGNIGGLHVLIGNDSFGRWAELTYSDGSRGLLYYTSGGSVAFKAID